MADNEKLGDNGGLKADRSRDRPCARRVNEQRVIFKGKQKTEENGLPEPPPDPWACSWHARNSQNLLDVTENQNLDEDEDIISCLTYFGTSPFEGQTSECPSRNSVTSTMATSNVYVDDVFEHLDRLYAFTEEILELRNRNTKFFKRVRNLERLKVLRTANQKLENAFMHDKDGTIDILDEDTGFAESLLDAMLSNCRDPPFQKRNVRSSSSRQGKNKLDVDKQPSTYQMSSSVPKVSKWTRVKAAFKWERACTNDPEIVDHTMTPIPSTPTTTTTNIPLSSSSTKCHRAADTEIGETKCTSFSPCVNEVYAQGIPFDQTSLTSLSNAEFYDCSRQNVPHNLTSQSPKSDNGKGRGNKNSRNQTLDDEHVALGAEQVKNAEVMNETNQRRSLIRIAPGKNRMVCSSSRMDEKDLESTSNTPTPALTIRIPSREDDIKYTSSPESNSPLFYNANISDVNSPQHRKTYQEQLSNKDFKRQQSLVDESVIRASKMHRQDSKWNKVRRAFLTNSTLSVPSNLINFAPKHIFLQDDVETSVSCNCNIDNVDDIEKVTRLNSRADARQDYQALKQKLGSEFHRKLTEWERLKSVSPHACAKDTRENSSNPSSPRECLLSEDRLAPEFRKKLQDWKRVKKIRRGSAPFEQQRISRRRLTDWQLWRSPSKAENRNREIPGLRVKSGDGDSANDGKSHLCEDFVRKMEAWRKTSESSNQEAKCSSPLSKGRGFSISTAIDESEFLALERLLSFFNGSAKRGRREFDVQQLDECFLRDTRLYTDGTQHENNANEVLVRTPVGSYRFEGISREFTRKLYDWEKYRGISPTSSTFRLLGPAYTPFARQTTIDESTIHPSITSVECDEPVSSKASILKRSKSVGSLIERSACKEFFLRRSNSLQSLELSMNNRFKFAGHLGNLAASIEPHATEDIAEDTMDDSEPEAVIVDIEDVIEETASPLERVQPRQTPVYSVAASETTSIAVPLGTVTSSHEPSPIFFVEMEETADKNHRLPKVCNQRKSFSSEESLSMEHFETVNRHCSRHDDIELNHWSAANSLNEGKNTTNDTTTDHLHRELDKISVESNGSICSPEPASMYNATDTSKVMTKPTNSNFVRKSGPVVSSVDEIPIETIAKEHCPDDEIRSNVEQPRLARCRYKRNLADLDKLGREADNQAAQDSDLTDKEKIGAGIAIRRDHEYEEVIVNNNDSRYRSFANAHPVESSKEENVKNSPDLSATRVTDKSNRAAYNEKYRYINRAVQRFEKFEENYGVIRDDVYNTHYDTTKIKVDQGTSEPSKSYDAYHDRAEEMIRSTGTVTSGRTVERTERQEFRNDGNISAFLMLRATNSPIREDHCEPIVQTTAYTVAPYRQERYLERIVINEDTLNKIVVPTTATGRSTEVNASEQPEDRTNSENSAVKRQRRSSTNDETPSDQDPCTKKQISNSPGRNVFIRTKRIIFSPFRRSEERSASKKEGYTFENDHLTSTKNRNKSRSASPKINRQDALFRMSLSLPWPLRSSSKDRETKESTVGKGDEKKPMIVGKQNLEQCLSMEMSEKSFPGKSYVYRTRMNGEMSPLRGRRSSIESTRRTNELRYSIEENEPSYEGSSSILKSENKINGARSLTKLDPYSSDLMYKLNILSNVVAKRDGRENAIPGGSPLETHSLRIRRAKEDFLSNRGGPLCHSLIDSPPARRDSFRRRASHYYEEIVESQEGVQTKEISSHSNRVPSPVYVSGNRQSRQESTGEKEARQFVNEYNELSNNSIVSRADRIKSASVGMINVDPDTFERLTQTNRGCDSLPRTISKQRQTLGPIARIVGRFKFARLIRGKDADEEKSTIAKLCRQSLLIDIRNDFEKSWKGGNRT